MQLSNRCELTTTVYPFGVGTASVSNIGMIVVKNIIRMIANAPMTIRIRDLNVLDVREAIQTNCELYLHRLEDHPKLAGS